MAPACNAADQGSVPGLERSPGEGNRYPLQYSCLENPMDREPWRATGATTPPGSSRGHKESDTTEQLTISHEVNEPTGLSTRGEISDTHRPGTPV